VRVHSFLNKGHELAKALLGHQRKGCIDDNILSPS
jgi:hypothetical protein